MKQVYSVVLTPVQEGGFCVYVPDLDINTQGEDLPDAIYMARDAISLVGIDMIDEGKEIPEPVPFDQVRVEGNQIKTLVDVDFDSYRKMLDTRAVKKTVSIPAWMDTKAGEMKLSLSKVLQEALEVQFKID